MNGGISVVGRLSIHAVACVLVSSLVTACASPVPGLDDPSAALTASMNDGPRVRSRRALSAAERERFEQARRLVGLGRVDRAVEELRTLVEVRPDALDAHRLLQSILRRSPADWAMREHYATRLRDAPDSADAHYLAARIEPDSARQMELFERAVELEPSHPYAWVGVALGAEQEGRQDDAVLAAIRSGLLDPELALPWVFLGTIALRRAQYDEAARYYEEALARDGLDASSWTGLAAAARGLRNPERAHAAALRAVELAPGRVGTIDSLLSLLELWPDASVADRAAGQLIAALPRVAHRTLVEGRVGELLLVAGRPEEALAHLEAAVASGSDRFALHRARRLARFRCGEFGRAVEDWMAWAPPELSRPENLLADRWEALRAAAGVADAGRLSPLAAAVLAVGWREEFRAVVAHGTDASVDADQLAGLSRREAQFDQLLLSLGEMARNLTDAARSGQSDVTFDGLLEEVARRSVACLGRDVTDGLVERSYPFLGSFALSVASDGPVEVEFGGRGLVLTVGRRAGSPPELSVARMAYVERDRRASLLGESVDFDLIWTSSEGVPPDLAGPREHVAGLTLDRLVLLSWDAAFQDVPPEAAGLAVVPRPGHMSSDRLATDTPSGVAGRLLRTVARETRLGPLQLEAVEQHEVVHVYDARRMLPVERHPLRALAFVLGHGFDGAAAERTLEGRAAGISLVTAAEPRVALAALLSFLPERQGETAHAAGYHDVLHELLRLLDERRAAFPSLDYDRNLLQQLDRLSPDDVRRLGRWLAEDL